MPPKSVKGSVSTGKSDKFPVSKVDYSQPLIAKNSKVTFDTKLDQAKEQHRDRLDDLIFEMDEMKRENDRLRRQQQDTFGVSLDTVDRMKKELERARTTRMFLLEDIELRKAKSEKMEAEIFELNMKLESYTKKVNELNKTRTEWQDASERLHKTEDKCEKLIKVNKNLRMLMLKHNIDPQSADFESGRSKKSTRIEKKSTQKPGDMKKKQDSYKQSYINNSSPGSKTSRSITDIRETSHPVNDDVKRRAPTTSRRAPDRGPPSYLGYYSDIHQHRMLAKTKLDSVHLPKLVAV